MEEEEELIQILVGKKELQNELEKMASKSFTLAWKALSKKVPRPFDFQEHLKEKMSLIHEDLVVSSTSLLFVRDQIVKCFLSNHSQNYEEMKEQSSEDLLQLDPHDSSSDTRCLILNILSDEDRETLIDVLTGSLIKRNGRSLNTIAAVAESVHRQPFLDFLTSCRERSGFPYLFCDFFLNKLS